MPFESGGMASLKASAAPITYPMFIRVMTSEDSTIDCLGKAKADAQEIAEKRKREEEESESEDEEEEDNGEEQKTATMDENEQEGGGEDGDVAEKVVVVEKIRYRAPKSKGERNAYAFLDQCKKKFLVSYKEKDDLEECLSITWDTFCDECEGRLAEDKNLVKAFKVLKAVFDM